MVTGSEDGAATVDPGSAAEGTPSLDEDLGLLLDEIVPGGRWRLLAATRDAAARFLDHRLGAVGPAHAEPVGADEPGWPARLRGLGPDEGIVVVAEPTRWDVAVEALAAARLHPGPLVLVADPTDGAPDAADEHAGAGDEDEGVGEIADGSAGDPDAAEPDGFGVRVLLATATGAVPARVVVSHRELLKGDGADAGRQHARRRVSTDGTTATAGSDAGPLTVDLRRWHPIGRRPGIGAPLTCDPDGLADVVAKLAEEEALPRWVEVTAADAHDAHNAHNAQNARDVLALLALGVPVLAEALLPGLADPVRRRLARLHDLDLWDPGVQEAASVDLRRAALAAHGHPGALDAGGPRPPFRVPVSVLLASNRPEHIDDAVARVLAQDHRPLEVVVAAHGIDPAQVTARSDDIEVVVLGVPGEATLGEALQAATDAASGAVLCKMDDDDLYAPTHVTDLVLALRYAGATLVGKAPEFVHLAGLDVTVRRGLAFERFGGHLAGGTFGIHRDDLLEVGGWAGVPRAVDSRLIDAVHRAGGTVYRAHGLGFVLNRHGGDHAFAVDDVRYLERTVGQRAGLDLGFAGVTGLAAGEGVDGG